MAATDSGDRLLSALHDLEAVADEVTAEEAVNVIDEATLQVFWRDWPNLGAWAGSVWRRLDQDFAGPATPPGDPELDEVGESG